MAKGKSWECADSGEKSKKLKIVIDNLLNNNLHMGNVKLTVCP